MYYYFYRQVDVVPGFGAPANEEVLECGLQNPPTHYAAGGHVFGLPVGYWEETTETIKGSPPDGFLRTSTVYTLQEVLLMDVYQMKIQAEL